MRWTPAVRTARHSFWWRSPARAAAPADAGPGAVSFLQRFGSALNEHWHYHCCVSDGVFAQASDGGLEFIPAQVDRQTDVAAVQAHVRRRVLAAYRRRGWLDAEGAANRAQWQHGGGFSVDASVAIHGNDRAGLERLLRYCARPCWASERLTPSGTGERLIYTLPRPSLDGSCQITLTPLELLDRLVRFIPAPRRHLLRGPPWADPRWDAIDVGDSEATYPNPATQVMPDYENQRQDLSW